MGSTMSIKIAYRDGVFEPLDGVEGAKPGAIYTAFLGRGAARFS